MKEGQLTYEDFSGKVGTAFQFAETNLGASELILVEVRLSTTAKRPQAVRAPFSLFFTAQSERVLDQRIYELHEASLGSLAIFLVAVGKDERGFRYQAVFS